MKQIRKRMSIAGFAVVLLMAIGCASSPLIREQSAPDLSLVIISVGLPSGYGVISSTITNGKENEFGTVYAGSPSDKIRSKLLVFENVAEGKYRLKKVRAQTDRRTSFAGNNTYRTTWNTIDIGFTGLTQAVAPDRDGWIAVQPGKVVYYGDIQWITNEHKEEFLNRTAEILKKSRAVIESGIIAKYTLVIDGKDGIKPTPGFLFRYDHPGIFGEKFALRNEFSMLKVLLSDTGKKAPLWSKLISKRMMEIAERLNSLPE